MKSHVLMNFKILMRFIAGSIKSDYERFWDNKE